MGISVLLPRELSGQKVSMCKAQRKVAFKIYSQLNREKIVGLDAH